MLIQCTKSLLDKLEIDKRELKTLDEHEHIQDSIKAWHANLVNIGRRKAIVLMNNKTRYSVVIYRPKPKDFTRIKELIRQAIIVALRMEGVRGGVIESYLADAGEIEFSTTANRSMVAKLNNAVRDVECSEEYLDESIQIQRYISIITGRFIQNSLAEDYFYPIEKMLECLGVYCDHAEKGTQKDVLDVDLYQLKINVEIEGFDIWRRVLVPSTYSFRHLHNVIQTVFDWQNCHLHAFETKREGAKGKRIVMDNDPETTEWSDFDSCDVVQERFSALEDVFPVYGEVAYEYDFGDSWEHTVKLEGIIKSGLFKAIYLEGMGERPPEDVGGSWGYQEYLRIMNDKEDPEHESMKAWAETQKERKLSPEKINARLRHSISEYEYTYI